MEVNTFILPQALNETGLYRYVAPRKTVDCIDFRSGMWCVMSPDRTLAGTQSEVETAPIPKQTLGRLGASTQGIPKL